jgi:probable dihydroxyacetone kinase regulator
MPSRKNTKKVLADELRSLMQIYPFEQITVTQLCESCGVNRKSFYYHYKDKYDVINQIFDNEMMNSSLSSRNLSGWIYLRCLCEYFYENREFYRKALEINGQNSFAEHFQESIFRRISESYRLEYEEDDLSEFQLYFFTDAIVMSIQRWLCSKAPMNPDVFISQIKKCLQAIAAAAPDW